MKKLNYTLTVYKNTGFNGLDIPQSPAVLENATKQTYNDVYYLREDIDLPQIQVNDNYHNLADVDYVKLTSNDVGSPSYYYFATPHAMAGGTTMLSLELDALTTMGGAGNIDYISGWQERGHIAKSEDVIFANTAPEEWLPSQPLKTSAFEEVTGNIPSITHPSQDLQVIITNIDLVKLGKLQDNEMDVVSCGVIDAQGQMTDVNMYIPKIEITQSATTFQIVTTPGSSSSTASLKIPNTCAYDATNPIIKKGLEKLFSAGQLQLQGSYTIPREYVIESQGGQAGVVQEIDPDTGNVNGRYTLITGSYNLKEMTNFPFEYVEGSYTPKNKKVFSMYRMFTLANLATGSSVTKSADELKYTNFGCPVVQQWADPTSTGKPSAKFLSDGQSNIVFVDNVSGSNWINNQILMEGASGSLWNTINTAFAQQSLSREMTMSKINNDFACKQYDIQRYELSIQQANERLGNTLKFGGAAVALGAGITALTGGTALPLMAGIGALAGGASGLLSAGNALGNQSALQNMQKESLRFTQEQTMANFQYQSDKYAQSANENRVGLIRSNSVVAPTTMFQPEPNLAMYGFNKFVVYETRMREDDLKSLDDYFQRFGYNGIHRKLEQACFNCRQYYCYVQAFDINIKATGSYGMRVRNKAISQLNGGVRVWKVLPDAQYYETN